MAINRHHAFVAVYYRISKLLCYECLHYVIMALLRQR